MKSPRPHSWKGLATLVILFLSAHGCAYTYGEKVNSPAVFEGVGWDSNLAYGDAVSKATGKVADPLNPSRVKMSCYMYGVKPAGGVLALLIAGAVKTQGAIIGAMLASAALALAPNCFSTVVYETQPDPKPMIMPHRLQRPAVDDDGRPLRPVRNRSEILVPPPAEDSESPPPGPPAALPHF